MGEVFRARDTKLGREVAVKVLPDHLANDPKALARFETEARAVAALSHPHILAIHDFGRIDGTSFAVTELLEGESLRALVTRGPISTKRALEIVRQVADALASAHERGIVHRDVKPENVFLTRDGHVKLLDFGLARHSAPLSDPSDTRSPTAPILTDAGALLGTVAYMSPQQARGLSVDHRSDQFSLGVVLYEMLSGRRPFLGASAAETLAAIIRDEPESLATATPSVSVGVRLLVERCLAKAPEERYDSTRDLARDLDASFLRLASGLDALVAAASRAPRASKRRVASRMAVGLVSAALLAAAGLLTLRHRTAAPPADPPAAATKRLAVAPFENRTGDASLDPVGRVAQEWISDELSRTSLGEVVAAGDAAAALAGSPREGAGGGPRDPVGTIARATGADVVVTGTVDAAGSDLRIQARVVEATSGRLLYAVEPADGPRSDPMVAIREIWRRVRDTVASRLLSRDFDILGEESRPPRFEACQEFVAAREPGLDIATRLVHARKAVELDPGFFSARILLVELLNGSYAREEAASQLSTLEAQTASLTPIQRLTMRGDRALLRGRYEDAFAEQAELVRLLPARVDHLVFLADLALRTNRPRRAVEILSSPQARGSGRLARHRLIFLCRAYHLLRNYEKELETTRELIASFPASQVPRWHEAGALVGLGRVPEAIESVRSVVPAATSPLLAATAYYYGASELAAHGRRTEAAALAAEGADWIASHVPEKDRKARDSAVVLPDLLCLAGRFAEARPLLDAAVDDARKVDAAGGTWDHATFLARRGLVAIRLGDEATARQDAAELHGIDRPFTLGDVSFARAVLAAQLGQKREALALLRQAVAEGYDVTFPYALWFHLFFGLEPLRGDPEFEELLKPKG